MSIDFFIFIATAIFLVFESIIIYIYSDKHIGAIDSLQKNFPKDYERLFGTTKVAKLGSFFPKRSFFWLNTLYREQLKNFHDEKIVTFVKTAWKWGLAMYIFPLIYMFALMLITITLVLLKPEFIVTSSKYSSEDWGVIMQMLGTVVMLIVVVALAIKHVFTHKEGEPKKPFLPWKLLLKIILASIIVFFGGFIVFLWSEGRMDLLMALLE